MPTAEEYVQEAREWIGTPFVHANHTKGVGCDCLGLVIGAAHNVGLTDYWPPPYAPETELSVSDIEAMLTVLTVPILAVWQPGDVVWIRMKRFFPNHCGVWTGEGTFIHCYQSAGQVCESPLEDFWKSRIVGVYRWKGLDG